MPFWNPFTGREVIYEKKTYLDLLKKKKPNGAFYTENDLKRKPSPEEVAYNQKRLSKEKAPDAKNTKRSNLKKERGCVPSNLKKYKTRPSPPFPGNECCGLKRMGNDGLDYESVPDKNGVCKWKRTE